MVTGMTAGSLFLEGLLSFFSPCVLPLVPLYFAYLTAGAKREDEEGNIKYDRVKVMILTVGFVLGISTVFMIAGAGSSLIRSVFEGNKVIFEIIFGMILVFMGLIALNIIQVNAANPFAKLNINTRKSNTFLGAWMTGFGLSLVWSPCIGPMLMKALVTASSAETSAAGWMYIGCYTLGFIFVFLLAGLFTSEVLNFLKKYRGVVRWTSLISGLIVCGMGVWLVYSGCIDYRKAVETAVQEEVVPEEGSEDGDTTTTDTYDFVLKDSEGNDVSLKDYRGKVVILDFYETWCGYCNDALPELAQLDQEEDIQVLVVVTPNNGSEGSKQYIEKFISDKGLSMKLLFDYDLTVTKMFYVSGYPTTYFITPKGEYYGYYPGYASMEELQYVIEQCRNS